MKKRNYEYIRFCDEEGCINHKRIRKDSEEDIKLWFCGEHKEGEKEE